MPVLQQAILRREDEELARRSTKEVIEDHIRLRVAGQLDEDLRRNYTENAVLLTEDGSAWDREALRHMVSRLYSPGLSYEMNSLQVHGDAGLLVWKACWREFSVVSGVDSFVVNGGKIQRHMSHYRLLQHNPANSGSVDL